MDCGHVRDEESNVDNVDLEIHYFSYFLCPSRFRKGGISNQVAASRSTVRPTTQLRLKGLSFSLNKEFAAAAAVFMVYVKLVDPVTFVCGTKSKIKGNSGSVRRNAPAAITHGF